MITEKITLPEIKLLGMTTRTNNRNEIDPAQSKIAEMAGQYWQQGMANAFIGRKQPGVTYSVYTEYESDEHGDYTYFIGEAVESFDKQDTETFQSLVIPASTYQKFTTPAGKMPDIVISAWQSIWQMAPSDFMGKRKYIADFEIYDDRAEALDNAIVDIYIGIQ